MRLRFKTSMIVINWLVICVPCTAETMFVRGDATGLNNGSSWANAYTALGTAISAASFGDEIWVAEGIYQPITLKDGVRICGGFSGSETSLGQSDPALHRTIISGSNLHRAIEGNRETNATELRGVHIVAGAATDHLGGGAYLQYSDAMFVECVFQDSKATIFGGAVAIWGGGPTFVNCRFLNNEAGYAGGAVYSHKEATPTFINCLFAKNRATDAGAIAIVTGSVSLINCTLADNMASVGKVGGIFDSRGEAVIRNSILWMNRCASGTPIEVFNKPVAGRRSSIEHTNISGGWSGLGNKSIDPLFVSPAQTDYRIQLGSPCRDSGLTAYLHADIADVNLNGSRTEIIPSDLAANSRINGDSVDMGAFERQ